MLTSKWSSDSSSPEPDDREISSFDESPIEITNDRTERGSKTRDDSSEDSHSTSPMLSSDGSELLYDDCSTEDPRYESDANANANANADPEDWDDWGIALEPQDDTITKLMNTIDSNKVALPEKAEVQDFKVAGDNKEVTLTEGYQFVNQVDIDKVTKAFIESQWPLDLATEERIDLALNSAKNKKKSNIYEKREETGSIGEEPSKDWGSDREKGKRIERVKGEGKTKEVHVKAAEKFEWTDEEQMKWENIPF